MTPEHPSAEQLALDLAPESAHDLYHRAPCGYLVTGTDGAIARVNKTFLDWTGHAEADLVGEKLFSDLLWVGSRIFHETHVAPLLAMQGEVREIALDVLTTDGRRLPTFVNAINVAGTDTVPAHVRITVFDASQRHEYEAELLRARKSAEESEHRVRSVAETLQRSLMHGGLTSGDGFAIETRYRPAFRTLEIGGDWHDSFFVDDRTLAVSVGDVVGRGITAACAMGQLRTAMRALAGTGIGPGPLLDQIDLFVGSRIPDARFATVAYAEIDTATGLARYACAGHLPPLVVDRHGSAEYLWGGRSGPIADVPRTRPRPEATTELGDGSRTYLYTDGLIERRSRGIDPGLERLAKVAEDLVDEPLPTGTDRLLAELLDDEDNSDDVCLLALQLDRT